MHHSVYTGNTAIEGYYVSPRSYIVKHQRYVWNSDFMSKPCYFVMETLIKDIKFLFDHSSLSKNVFCIIRGF